MLRIWGDTNRWRTVLPGDGAGSPADRRVWDQAFHRWEQLRDRLLEHARAISDFRPLRQTCALLAERGAPAWAGEMAERLGRRRGRHDDWVAAVAASVSAIDRAVEEVHRRPTGSALQRLVDAGRQLHELFSGRGYFNSRGTD